jgi:hypothetical protein
LSVAEQENGLSLFKACDFHDFLNFLHPIFRIDFIVLSHVGNVRAQHGQRLSSTASDTYQQGMTESSGQHSHDLDDMLNGDHEQHQVHSVT